MSTEAKTIQIFLPDGDPRGIRIAEITTRIVQAIAVPRTQLNQFFGRPEAQHVALYFLFGQTEDQAKPVVYVGQTEDVPNRLKDHNAKKDFWQTAVLVISRTNSFTQAHIKYLEWFCIAQAQEAGRYALDNGNAGQEPHVTEPMLADIMDAFSTARSLLGTLGFPVFEPLAEKTKHHEVFYCKGPDADAKGQLVEDGFVVLKGALLRAEPVPSAKWLRARLDTLEENGLLERISPAQYRLTQDYLANSTSQAAIMVLGRNANGWTEWKDKDGKTLHELKRANAQE